MGKNSKPVPRWFEKEKELWWKGQLVLKFKRPAPLMDSLLRKFQRLKWPVDIRDPLPPLDPKKRKKSHQRLHDLIKRMNRLLKGKGLRFHGNGYGDGVSWEVVKDEPQISPRIGPRRTVEKAGGVD